MKLLLLGCLLTSLAFSVALNAMFYSGRLTPEQQVLAGDCNDAKDAVSCIYERNMAGR